MNTFKLGADFTSPGYVYGGVKFDNTTGNVFRDTRDNQLYVLAAGRWFRTTTEAGPWLYVPHDKLPRDFGAIPDDSPKENAKASIAGTTE